MKKTKKTQLGLLFRPKHVGKGRESVTIEIIIPGISYPNRNRELKKNSKKTQKIRKHQFGFFSGQNRLGKAKKE